MRLLLDSKLTSFHVNDLIFIRKFPRISFPPLTVALGRKPGVLGSVRGSYSSNTKFGQTDRLAVALDVYVFHFDWTSRLSIGSPPPLCSQVPIIQGVVDDSWTGSGNLCALRIHYKAWELLLRNQSVATMPGDTRQHMPTLVLDLLCPLYT